ncbi:MAG: hypothetical protein IT435_06220 [Phycisphaerales bacterium]|nr:hypothetical protein [Phycisphaerales bacterium]
MCSREVLRAAVAAAADLQGRHRDEGVARARLEERERAILHLSDRPAAIIHGVDKQDPARGRCARVGVPSPQHQLGGPGRIVGHVHRVEQQGKPAQELGAAGGPVTSLAFSPDGRQLAASHADGNVRIWSLDESTPPLVRPFEGFTHAVAWSPDGARLAVAGASLPIAIIDATTGDDLLRLRLESLNPPHGLAFSRDGNTLYALGPPNAWATFETAPVASAQTRLTRYLAAHAQRLVNKWRQQLYIGEVLARMIQADVSADEELRATALKIASGEGDCYHWTNSSVWGAVQDASRPQQEADRAVTIAEVICARFPNNGGFLNTLGIAYYRAGRYGEALRTLHRSDELNRKDTGRSHPIDLAAIIMTLVKLDR